jgi:hypothetical protein
MPTKDDREAPLRNRLEALEKLLMLILLYSDNSYRDIFYTLDDLARESRQRRTALAFTRLRRVAENLLAEGPFPPLLPNSPALFPLECSSRVGGTEVRGR